MTRIRLVLPYPPSINRWKDPGSGHAYLTPEVKRYKAAADALVRRHLGAVEPLQGPVRLRLDLWRPIRTGDISNRIKILEDCLRGLVFTDDSQVAALEVLRFEDSKRPRVSICVETCTPLEFQPLMMPSEGERDAVEVGRILAEARRKSTQARAKKKALVTPATSAWQFPSAEPAPSFSPDPRLNPKAKLTPSYRPPRKP